MLQGLSSTGNYFSQVLSISPTPVVGFTGSYWQNLVDLLMSLLTNPFFYAIIGIILIMSLLPKFQD